MLWKEKEDQIVNKEWPGSGLEYFKLNKEMYINKNQNINID